MATTNTTPPVNKINHMAHKQVKSQARNTTSFSSIMREQFLAKVTQISSQTELAMYPHHTMGSLPKSIFLAAIKNHPRVFNTFPGLT